VERTLTGSLCGFEALARWDDPSMGMISPSVFVPILEEAQLINRLDRFVLERVLGILRDRMDNGLPLIPVSINLSGCDFEVSNPFYTIEKLVSRYKVPRGALRFEITERVMIRHRNSMVSIISQFQKAGYQIWMDDFGSEYSSLNSLHNYHFDEIKIDMGFFSHFDDRSRQIITAVVVMAKMLGVMTLAEGVETEEQVEFLKKIGCGRIQGYYFGQPMPYEECLEFIHDKNLKIESQTECSMLDPAENVNVNSELPTAIFYFDGNEIMLLLENDAYRRELRSTGTQSLQEANLNLRAMDHPLRNRFFGLLTKALKSRTEESMIYVDNGQYIKVSVQWIAGSEQKWVGATRLYNISTKSEIQSEKILDSFLRNMFHIYDGLYMLDREKDEIRVLQCVHPKVHPGENFRHILSSFQAFTEELVHPEDQKRFLDFIRPENLEMETFHTAGNSVSELVRVRREDGTYRWTIFEALVIYKSRTKNILLCEREDIWEKKRDREKLLPAFCRSFNAGSCNCGGSAQPLEMSLFRTLQTYSPYPFFWKGRNGRILGTSTALRKLAGLPDEKAVLGKTEAELGWLIDPSVVESTESKVLHGGERLELTTEQVLTDGRLQKIGIAWAPFYQEKNLIGALGMVGSRGEDSKGEEERLGLTDPDTGLLSFRGAIEAGLLYADQYRLQKVDYVGLLIKISAFSDIQRESPRLAVTLLAETVQTLHRVLTPGWTISRTGICSFLCFCHRGENTNIAGKVEILTESLKQLWKKFSLPGNPQMIAASVFGSETRSFDDMLQLLIRRLSSVENQLFGSSTYTGDRVIIRKEAFDKLTERVVISDPKTYELVYLNQAARTTLGIGPDESLEGKICYETLEGNDAPCRDCLNVLLRQDRFCCISHICRKTGENLLVRSCLIPWEDRILRFTFAFNMSEYINTMTKDHELVYQEMRANEVISLGITEENADRGIEKMIEYISNNLKPERFLIFEERDDSTVSATYEWTAPGILPLKEELQSVPREGLRALYKEFTLHHVVMISDIVAFRREHPDFNLRIYGAKSFISGQLTLPDRSEGFTMVVNPSQETFRQASLLLSTLTDFIAVMIRNRNSMRRLEELSMRDQLTGVRNRWGLEKQVREWKDESLLGVISVDLNGLKKTNDIQGHHAGDMLIQEAARILGECAGRECVFRVGGDEFIVLTKEMEENDIRLLVRNIRDTAQDNGISMALGYAVSTGIDADTDTLLTRADLKMYDDKAHSLYRRRDD
jgi:diguanylate cyclase (GGDEF)-like protein